MCELLAYSESDVSALMELTGQLRWLSDEQMAELAPQLWPDGANIAWLLVWSRASCEGLWVQHPIPASQEPHGQVLLLFLVLFMCMRSSGGLRPLA